MKIYYIIPPLVFITLIILGFAYVPPPVDQRIGVYDTLYVNLTEFKCRTCHTSGGTAYDPATINKSTNSVPDRHHMLAMVGRYNCQNCHPVIYINGSQSITLMRDCMKCHDTIFNNMTIRRPHHETLDAQEKHCSKCHGNLVDDYDDGHYIPTYNISEVTPDTKFKVINQSSGKKWGGCEACHEQNLVLDPMIGYNNRTHHKLGKLSEQCLQCHDLHSGEFGSDSVRYCERCHAVKSLHNIQYDYANTSGILGNGHIGANWDCNGCHAWYVAGDIAPGTDIIIPNIETISSNKILEGDTVLFVIKGINFVTTSGNVNYSSVVVITDGKNITTITPTSISSTEITVTIPSLSRGAYGIYALNNGSVKSNKMSLVSVPKVYVNSAMKSGTIVTIKGSGFGPYDPDYNIWVNVTIKRGTTSRNLQITGWSDNQINLTSSDVLYGDIVYVNSIYGSNSTKVVKR